MPTDPDTVADERSEQQFFFHARILIHASVERPFVVRRMIPLEVCEQVIDAVSTLPAPSNDLNGAWHLQRSTLISCALTCRSWLYRSRSHLHRSILISGHKRAHFDRFVAILQCTPQVATLVRRVSIYKRRSKVDTVMHLIPVYLAGRLKNLQDLAIEGFNLRAVHPVFYMAARGFKTVTRLFLFNIDFGSSRELTRLVFSLPSLELLRIASVRFAKLRSCQLFKSFKKKLPLRELWFQDARHGFPILRVLGETNSNCKLDSLDTDFTLEEIEAQEVGNFIKGCPVLKNLSINVRPNWPVLESGTPKVQSSFALIATSVDILLLGSNRRSYGIQASIARECAKSRSAAVHRRSEPCRLFLPRSPAADPTPADHRDAANHAFPDRARCNVAGGTRLAIFRRRSNQLAIWLA